METIRDLQAIADQVGEIIGEPVEIEMENGGGWDLCIWIGDGKDRQPLALPCSGIDFDDEDAEPYTAATDCHNTLMTIQAVVEWLKEAGKLK